MSFEPVNDLERSLVKAAVDPAYRPQFYRDLLGAELFMPQDGKSESGLGKSSVAKDEVLELMTFEHEGKRLIPLFSSLERLREFIEEETQYLLMKAIDLFQITRGEMLVLNPGADFGKEFTPEEVTWMLEASFSAVGQEQTLDSDTEVILGEPAVRPEELIETLVRYFKTAPAVQKAYLAQFMNPKADERPHTLIAVEVSDGWEGIVRDLGLIVGEVEVPDPPVDFIRYTSEGSLAEYFRETKAFYEKKKKLFGILG